MSAARLSGRFAKLGRGAQIAYGVALVVVAVVVLFALNAVYGFFNTSTTSAGAQRTATVAFGTVQSSVSASGNVSAANSASVDFGTSGTLTSVKVAVGNKVKAGQVLGTIDPTTAQTTLEAAQANLAQAQSALATAQNGPTASQKATNASSLLQAETQLSSARQQLSVDQAAVTTAKAQLKSDQALACPASGSSSSGTAATSSSAASGNSSSSGASAATTSSGSTFSSSGSGATTSKKASTNIAAATPGTTTTTSSSSPSSSSSSSPASSSSAPTVSTGSPSTVGSSTASVTGTVSPAGQETTYEFQYGTSAGSLGSRTTQLDAGSGNSPVSVSADLTGLKPAQTYYVRLAATNSTGTVNGAEVSFTTTAAAAPTATTSSASNVLTKTATLNGTVTPNGSDTKYHFEYGTTAAYGRKTATVDAGSGTTATQATAAISGLKPNTSYLFRLVATNSFGTSDGIGQLLKTAQSSCVVDAAAITSAEQTVGTQRTAVTTAEANLAQTKATIATSVQPSAATIAQDEVAVKQDEATVAADQTALDETTLKAPIAGTVTALNGSVGATVSGSGSSVSRGAANASSSSSSSSGFSASSTSSGSGSSSSSPFVTLDSLDTLEIIAGFAEADATKLAVGEPATITFPALPTTEVAGKVIAVASTSTVVSNVVTYNVTILLVNPPSVVKEGMTANVSVITGTRSHVLELPSAAITTTGTFSTVALLSGGKTTTTRITTGLVGSSSTQILSGVKNGDVVVVPTVAIAAATATTSSTGSGTLGGGLGGGGFGGFGGAGGGGGFTRGG